MTLSRGRPRPRLLDLFSGAGGAAVGYFRAGFDVVGVDIVEQPRYPFPFVQGDALHPPVRLEDFDVIHASPPCQAYSPGARMRLGHAKEHPRLIEPVREMLLAWGGTYIIENVPEAPLRSPVRMCGSGPSLAVRRHRAFESNRMLLAEACAHSRQPVVVGVYGDHPEDSVIRKGHPARRAKDVADAQDALGIHWTDRWGELKEAIPPAYTEWIGSQLIDQLVAASPSTGEGSHG